MLSVVVALVLVLVMLTVIDIPWLEFLSQPHLIRIAA